MKRINVCIFAIVATLSGCSSTISGRPYNESMMCWGSLEEAGEGSLSEGCDTAITYAEDKSGNMWEFPDSCIPDDFEEIMLENSRFEELVNSPKCE